MNLVSLLIAPAVVALNYGNGDNDNLARIGIAVVAAAIIVGAVVWSKQKPISMGEPSAPTGTGSTTGSSTRISA
jgi:K(+)-stimulated pyrophosphate-energized sodium pump